jgi:hypothetical protein
VIVWRASRLVFADFCQVKISLAGDSTTQLAKGSSCIAFRTCFLPYFPRMLQGRAKTAASSRVVNEWQKLRELALPDLAALIGGLLPEYFFAKAPDTKAKHERLYPPVRLFWAFLFQGSTPPCLARKSRRQDPRLSAYTP